MLEDDHSKECGNFIAKNSQNIEKCTQLGYNFYFLSHGIKSKNYTPAEYTFQYFANFLL